MMSAIVESLAGIEANVVTVDKGPTPLNISEGNVSCPTPDENQPEESNLESIGGDNAGSTVDSSGWNSTRGTSVVDSECQAKASEKLSSSSWDRKETGGKGGMEEVSTFNMGKLSSRPCDRTDTVKGGMDEMSTLKMEAHTCDEPVTTLHMYLDSASARGDAIELKLNNVEGEMWGLWNDLARYSYNCSRIIMKRVDNAMQAIKGAKHENDTQAEELQKCHAQLESLKDGMKVLVKVKNHQIEVLQANLHASEENRKSLEMAIGKLEKKVYKMQQLLCEGRAGLDCSYVDGLPTPFLLESTSKDMFLAIDTFASSYAKYKRLDGSLPAKSLVQTHVPRLKSIDAYTTRDHHWTWILKAIICKCMFMNFESEAFIPSPRPDNTVLFLDPEERMRSCFKYFERSRSASQGTSICHGGNDKFDSLFSKYLNSTSSIFPGFEEISRFTPLPRQNISSSSIDSIRTPERNLVDSFFIAAKMVWDFHKLCFSFESPATIFRVANGEPYNEVYMDSPVTLEDDDRFLPKVGFVIHPGFRLRKTVIKSRVYFHINA